MFVMKWPEDGVLRIRTLGRDAHSFNGIIRKAELLGFDTPVETVLCGGHLTAIAQGVKSAAPVCLKLTVD